MKWDKKEKGRETPEEKVVGNFVRHIRNALDHSRVEIEENDLVFEDVDPRSGDIHTVIRLHSSDAIEFTFKLFDGLSKNTSGNE